MKKINFDLMKDIVISILIVIIIVLIFSIFFYDSNSFSRIVPEVEEYEMSEQMKEDLNYAYVKENTQVVTTYKIDAADLKKYEKNNEYNKGKKNPFAVESESPDVSQVNGNGTTQNNNQIVDQPFYEDNGIK